MTEDSKKTQVGIIIVSHADYGSAMLRTAEFILGPQSDCSSISVDIAHEVSETVRRLTDAAQRLGYPAREIVSGAGHDAVYMSYLAPTGMIFIPCRDGISHNEIEYASPEHVEAGANVLLQVMLQYARVV